MFTDQQLSQTDNEFRNIKLKLKGPERNSELQAVKALMAMSVQHHVCPNLINGTGINHNIATPRVRNNDHHHNNINRPQNHHRHHHHHTHNQNNHHHPQQKHARKDGNSHNEPIDLSRSESPEPIYGLSITMTEEEFKELAEKEGIKDVIGEPICKLCGGLFSGPLGIALHMCPAMKRQTYRCDICGEDKWKTKANLHSHIKWCKRRLSMKTEQTESKQIY